MMPYMNCQGNVTGLGKRRPQLEWLPDLTAKGVCLQPVHSHAALAKSQGPA